MATRVLPTRVPAIGAFPMRVPAVLPALPRVPEICPGDSSLRRYPARQRSPHSYKVLPMSSLAQRLSAKDSLESTHSMFTKVQSELADRYVEVEIEGLTLRRLGCIYIAAAQQTRFRMLQGVRSFFHLNPAH